MKNIFHSKTGIIVIIVVIILVIAYFYYEGGSGSSTASTSLLQQQASDQSIGAAELSLLDQIQSLKIDTSLFQDPAYKTLVDYSVPIPQDGVGRPNPFAPFPGEAVSVGTGGTGAAATH